MRSFARAFRPGRRRTARSLLVVVLVALAAFLGAPRRANADRRAENAAKTALKKAEDDYLRLDFDKGLRRLQNAERGCGETGCTTRTHAALARDVGVMQLRMGRTDAAAASFRRAKKLDPEIALNPSYETGDLREAWDAASAPSAPSAPSPPTPAGDFRHTPPPEARARTPLPVWVEPTTTEALAKVVVRYQGSGAGSFRRAPLERMDSGWGGTIPCADVVPGTMSYYVQGFDKEGELVASAGDPRTPFTVAVREAITTAPPALPGRPPPRECGDADLETLDLLAGERCTEDRQCRSGVCASERCSAPLPPEPAELGAARGWARLWIGVSGSLDFTALPTTSDACRAPGGVSTSRFWCTTPDGADYPAGKAQDDALVAGRAGQVPSGQITTGGAHVRVAIDYAASPNLLFGARLGYVVGAYPGSAAAAAGKTLGAPFHAELRASWVFGDEPLTRPGLAPYGFFGAGVARWDASTTVNVGERGVVGDRALQAWFVAGPAFASVGGGARYQFSARAAVSTGIDVTAAIFPAPFSLVAAPEMELQVGF